MLALKRTTDAGLVNALANDPEIRPTIGGNPDEPLDLTEAVENDRNIVLMGEHGGFILIWCAPNVYEVHTMIRREGRGAWARDAALTAIGILFDAYAVKHIWTRILPDALNVQAYALAAGMRGAGEAVFDIGDGPRTYSLFEIKEG